MFEVVSTSSEETQRLARRIAEVLPDDTVVCFFGDLAAGKTTFITSLAQALTGDDALDVTSPTFVYLNIYEGERTVYHFDLYRLDSVEAFLGMGFDEYFSAGGVTCVEWSERIESILDDVTLRVIMQHNGDNRRRIRFEGPWPERVFRMEQDL
ncbi:tRNA threonylcarbamoyladenosine biosynthesis protein TsaE [Chlamydiales bacterium SCGC AG-110-P3]|nr:tRNA threonylcarbamoyladenosine biosynthesis protein TsaE [Chlamydiales bacterium SCGC AG-110-P3]